MHLILVESRKVIYHWRRWDGALIPFYDGSVASHYVHGLRIRRRLQTVITSAYLMWLYYIFRVLVPLTRPTLVERTNYFTHECEQFFHVWAPCRLLVCTVLNPIHDLVNEIFHDHDKLIRFKIRTGIKRIRMAPWVWGPLCIKPGRSRHKICPLLLLLPPAQPILGFFHLQVVPSRTIIRSVSDIPYIQISGLTCCPTVQPSESTDITFKSSDNIKFCLHRRNLETHAEAFPGPDISVEQEEVINLTESSNVLAIVFNFMYPRKQADIEKMTFETVAQVAEAVEKYQVFSAMKVCEMRLK